MKLLEPYFLYAFLALAIPILIHLFSLQRHKTVYFSNVSFLRQLQQKKSNITKLQKLLLLLVRLLLLSAIILAFCEPYISKKETLSKQQNIAGIYIDNSFSMSANNDKGQLIEQAKNNARSVLKAHKGKDKFVFISNDLQGKHQRILAYKACLEAIDNTVVVPTVLPLNLVIDRFKSLVQNELNSSAELYLISDFQKTSSPESFYAQDQNLRTHLLPLNSYLQSNLSIDTCYLETPNHTINEQEWLVFEVSNTANQAIENLSVKLYVNGKQKALSSLKIEANSKTLAKLSFNNRTSGHQKAYLELSDATVTFDNRLYFNFEVQESTNVLSIYEKESHKSLANLYSDPLFKFKQVSMGALNYTEVNSQNLIILEDVMNPPSGLINVLKEYTDGGGNLLIFPSEELNLNTFKTLADALNIPRFTKLNSKKVKVSELNKNHVIFKDVFEKQALNSTYPEVSSYYSLANTYNSTKENILVLNTNEPFLNSYRNGMGSIYLQTSPLNLAANSIEKHALFVPILFNIATQSTVQDKLYYTIGTDRVVEIKKASSSKDWRIIKDDLELIPEIRTLDHQVQVNLQNTLQEDGFYSLSNGSSEKILSFNYNRLESDLTVWELEELEENSNLFTHINVWKKEGLKLEEALKENRSGTPLWRLFILLAFLLILLESVLLKNWKRKATITIEN